MQLNIIRIQLFRKCILDAVNFDIEVILNSLLKYVSNKHFIDIQYGFTDKEVIIWRNLPLFELNEILP